MFPTLRICFITFIALIQLCGLVQAQSDFQLIGNGGQAALGNNCFRLTQAQNTAYGAVWYRWQADLNQDFDLTADLNFGTNDFGADGIVFAFQNLCTNVGSTGGGMGIEGVNPSLFIEFDTFLNPDNSDLPDDHIGILSDGVLLHTGPTSLSAPVCALPNCGDIENGTNYNVRIFWQAAIQTMDVYFNGALRTSYTGDVINSIFAGNSMVYWGFTSATGGFNNSHTVCITNFTDNQIQPSDTTWCANQNITFSVGNPITTVTYQWQVSTNGGATFSNVTNSAVYSGSTTPTLNLTNSPSSVIGNLYQVVISGCGGQFISDPAEITAGLLVSITQQPTNQELCENDPATLSVTSPEATNYQWQEFIAGAWVSLTDDVAQGISGTQISNLNLIGAATAVGSRVYRCLLWADCSAEIISNQVTINHNPGPSIQNQPINQSVCLGTNTSFTINASGPGLTYQWQMSNDGGNNYTALVNGGVFSQVNTNSLLLSGVTAAINNALFQCVVTGDCGSPVQSISAVLTVQSPPAFTQQPINVQACVGNSEQFISASTGSESWQWEYSNDGGATFQNVPSAAPYNGSSSSTLTINPVTDNMQGWVFRVRATGCGQELTSNNASLNLFPALTVEPIPAQVTRCEGESLQISVQAENASTYQWELNTGSGFQPLLNTIGVNGENTSNLLITNMPASWHLAKLRCKIEGECTTLFSTILTLNVNGLPVLVAQPIVTPICSGSSFLLQVLSKGVGIQYQWEVLDGSGEFIPLNLTGFTGVESPDLSIASTSDMNGLILRCVLSGCDAEVNTDSIPLIILENEPVYIPNCFTPNEDQINPEFRLFTAGNPKLDASIYSRWGDLIFRWSDSNQGWDGKLNGAFVAEGLYVYKIKVETACETKNYTGRIQVIR
jgi:gliding motility-associated-like protein